jgi:hypothetical protein
VEKGFRFRATEENIISVISKTGKLSKSFWQELFIRATVVLRTAQNKDQLLDLEEPYL